MDGREPYYFESRTKDRRYDIAMTYDSLLELLEAYDAFLTYACASPKDVAYAKIYRPSDMGCIAKLVGKNGLVILQPKQVRGGVAGRHLRLSWFHMKDRWYDFLWWLRDTYGCEGDSNQTSGEDDEID